MRGGLFLQTDHSISDTTSQVLLTDNAGEPLSDVPTTLIDNGSKTEWIYSAYLQDEWKLMPDRHRQLRPALRPVHRLHQRQPGQSAAQCGVAGAARHDRACRLFALPVAAALRAGRRQGHRAVHEHHVPAAVAVSRITAGRAGELLRSRRAAEDHAASSPSGLDTYYKQSDNLIDEGQFGAPIILTPFNYRYGKQYGAEFTANYTTENFTAYLNFAATERQGQGHRFGAVQLSPDGSRPTSRTTTFISITSSSTPPRAACRTCGNDTRFSADFLVGSGLRADLPLPPGETTPYGGTVFRTASICRTTRRSIPAITHYLRFPAPAR